MDGRMKLLTSVLAWAILLIIILAGCGLFGGKKANIFGDSSPESYIPAVKIEKGQSFTPAKEGYFVEGDAVPKYIASGKIQRSPTQVSQEKAFTGLRWILFAGVIMASLGVGMFFIEKTLALSLVAGGGLMAGMALTLNQHYVLISWIGLGIGLAGIGLLIWMLWKNKDKLEAVGTGLIEVVMGNEVAKKILPAALKQKLYGATGDVFDKGIIGKDQSPATESLVKEIRKNGGVSRSDEDA